MTNTEGAQIQACAECGEPLSANERQQEFRVHIACIRRSDSAGSAGEDQ